MSPRAIDDEVMTGWKKKIYKLGSLQFFWLWINYMIRYLFIIFMSLVSRFSEPFSVIYMERFLLYFLPFITLCHLTSFSYVLFHQSVGLNGIILIVFSWIHILQKLLIGSTFLQMKSSQEEMKAVSSEIDGTIRTTSVKNNAYVCSTNHDLLCFVAPMMVERAHAHISHGMADDLDEAKYSHYKYWSNPLEMRQVKKTALNFWNSRLFFIIQ